MTGSEIGRCLKSSHPHRLARDYARIAPFYDCTVGITFFLRVRDAFEKLVRRYGIRFCSSDGGATLFRAAPGA